jgi:hypothetical protein
MVENERFGVVMPFQAFFKPFGYDKATESLRSPTTMNSVELRTSHQVLYTAPIIHDNGWKTGNEDGVWQVGGGDFIDLNHSGKVEYHKLPSMFLEARFMYDEPKLCDSMDTMRQWGQQNGKEVITSDDAPFSQVKQSGQVIGHTLFQTDHEIVANQRPISNLVREGFPQEPSAKWAIDLAHNEFIIYK